MLGDAAGGAADALGEGDEIFLAGAGLQEGAAEERQIGQEGLVEHAQVKADVEVENAEGRQRVVEHADAAHPTFLGGDGTDVAVEIGQGQRRDLGQILGLVDFFLQGFQPFGARDHRIDGGVVEGFAHGRELFGFLARLAGALLGIGLQEAGEAMRIVEEEAADFLFEMTFAGLVLERVERGFELQRRQGVAAMQPIAEG